MEGSQAIVPNSSAANEEDADSARSRAASPWEVANDPDATDNDIMTGDLLGFDDLPVERNPSTYNEEELEGSASKPSSTVNEQESHFAKGAARDFCKELLVLIDRRNLVLPYGSIKDCSIH